MRKATSGNDVPRATYTWLIANQAIAAGAAYQPAAVVVNGARTGNCTIVATARVALPATAAGSSPHIDCFCLADDAVTMRISNQSAAALVALGVDCPIDIQAFPLIP